VHELLGPASHTEVPAWVPTYKEALTAFESGDRPRARTFFTETDKARMHGDGPSRFFLDCLARGEIKSGVVSLKARQTKT